MELILQIAFGIALGFLLIVYHQKLLVFSRKAAVVIAGLAVVGGIGFGGYMAYERLMADVEESQDASHKVAKFQTDSGIILEFQIPAGYSKGQADAYAKGIEIGMKESALRAQFQAEKNKVDPNTVIWDEKPEATKPWERDWGAAKPAE